MAGYRRHVLLQQTSGVDRGHDLCGLVSLGHVLANLFQWTILGCPTARGRSLAHCDACVGKVSSSHENVSGSQRKFLCRTFLLWQLVDQISLRFGRALAALHSLQNGRHRQAHRKHEDSMARSASDEKRLSSTPGNTYAREMEDVHTRLLGSHS